MKYLNFSFFLIVPFLSFSQSSEVEVLEQRKEEIQSQIVALQDELYKVLQEISEVKNKKPEKPTEIEPARTVARNGGTIKTIPHTNGEVLLELESYTSMEVIDWENSFYKVRVRDTVGYIEANSIAEHNNVLKHKQNFFKKQKEKEAKKKEEDLAHQRLEWEEEERQQNRLLAKKRQEKEKRMIAKYGQDKVNRMKKGNVWLGMNEEQVIYALGRPKDVNRTVGSWGTKEQWVYNNSYLYFENGSLTSWQD